MRAVLWALCCIVVCVASTVVEAKVRFPKEKDLRGIRTSCGGGNTEQVRMRANQLVRKLKSDVTAQIDVENARRQLVAIVEVMEQSPPNETTRDLYKQYLSCVVGLIDKFLVVNNLPREPVNPGSGVDGFLSLGATYGSIRTVTGTDSYTNDNQPIALARVGWWFNEHIAFGLEGSYWQRKTDLSEVNTEWAQSGQPFRTTAATATVPLYLHLGRRFPLIVYFGAGRGWETNEYVGLNSSGAIQQRVTHRDSGRAFVAGAGFEFAWTENVSVTVLARGIRTEIESSPPPGSNGGRVKPERDALSLGVALSWH